MDFLEIFFGIIGKALVHGIPWAVFGEIKDTRNWGTHWSSLKKSQINFWRGCRRKCWRNLKIIILEIFGTHFWRNHHKNFQRSWRRSFKWNSRSGQSQKGSHWTISGEIPREVSGRFSGEILYNFKIFFGASLIDFFQRNPELSSESDKTLKESSGKFM